jgi:hypothetical protein
VASGAAAELGRGPEQSGEAQGRVRIRECAAGVLVPSGGIETAPAGRAPPPTGEGPEITRQQG